MVRKSTLFRLFGFTFLALAACFGTLTLTAQPAQALYCFQSWGACWFTHVEESETTLCCMYECPDGRQFSGVCERI